LVCRGDSLAFRQATRGRTRSTLGPDLLQCELSAADGSVNAGRVLGSNDRRDARMRPAEARDSRDKGRSVDRFGEVQLKTGAERLLPVFVARERRERGRRNARNVLGT